MIESERTKAQVIKGQGKPGRHAPAFILLILSIEATHGLGILHKMDEIAPGHRLDTAVIYRVLKKMEGQGCITWSWVENPLGPRKKVYKITSQGLEVLDLYKADIQGAIQRLTGFVTLYESTKKCRE